MGIFQRKLTATFFSTTIISLTFAFVVVILGFEDITYHLGNYLLGWAYVYMLYVGAIILIYGNLISIAIEYMQGKGFLKADWKYILLHGIFGLPLGILFQSVVGALYGLAAAMIYAIVDRVILVRKNKGKRIRPFYLLPVSLYIVSWLTLQILSPPMPPFTPEDAVEFATSGEGTTINQFPETIGTWEGEVDGYYVVRETSVEESSKETYIVTFHEKWEKDGNQGEWYLSYKVDRNSMTLFQNGGESPLNDFSHSGKN